MFAFWDAYPAYTPATALRRWDGAHTGPYGGRHGLYNLLRTAQSAQIPLVLLDLKEPASLSALDYAGGLDLVRQMAESGLLILPTSLPDPRFGPYSLPAQAQGQLQSATRWAATRFGLLASQFTYLPEAAIPPASGIGPASSRGPIFARLSPARLPAAPSSDAQPATALSLLSWAGRTVIPLPDEPAASPQADPDGLTLEWRRRLLSTALASQEDQPSSLPKEGGRG